MLVQINKPRAPLMPSMARICKVETVLSLPHNEDQDKKIREDGYNKVRDKMEGLSLQIQEVTYFLLLSKLIFFFKVSSSYLDNMSMI